MKNWYTMSKPTDAQGQIAEEETGRTVAVCYDAKDAPLLAGAPGLLAACRAVIAAEESGVHEEKMLAVRLARAAIASATEGGEG